LPSPLRRRCEGRRWCGSRGEANLFFWAPLHHPTLQQTNPNPNY
jgi:hypothetical protein